MDHTEVWHAVVKEKSTHFVTLSMLYCMYPYSVRVIPSNGRTNWEANIAGESATSNMYELAHGTKLPRVQGTKTHLIVFSVLIHF